MKAGLMLGVNPNAKRQEEDFYATDPYVINRSIEFFNKIELNNNVWECSCGNGSLSERLKKFGYDVYSSDIINRGYGEVADFLVSTSTDNRDIITNPPFKLAYQFVRHAYDIMSDGQKALFFLKIQFLETEKRAELFQECGLKYVGVMSNRVCCAMNGEFDKYFSKDRITGAYKGGTQMYAWYVFEKGYTGQAMLNWIV